MKEWWSRLAARPVASAVIALSVVAAVVAMMLVNPPDPGCGRPLVNSLARAADGRVASAYGDHYWAFAPDGSLQIVTGAMDPTGFDQQRCTSAGQCLRVQESGVYLGAAQVLGFSAGETDAVTAQTACAVRLLVFRDAIVRPVAGGEELWVAAGGQGLAIRHVDGTWERRAVFAAAPMDLHPLDLSFAPLVALACAAVWGSVRSRVRLFAVASNLAVVGIALVFGPSQNVWALSHRPLVWHAWTLIVTVLVQVVWITELSRKPQGS